MRKLGVFIILIVFLSCKSSEKSDQVLNASPSETVIEGVLIGQLDEKVGVDHPCKEQNCFANVRVSKILQRGNGLASAFAEGDEIKVYFAFGLQATGTDNFPNIATPLPGLAAEDHFRATIEISAVSPEEKRYSVYTYKKLK